MTNVPGGKTAVMVAAGAAVLSAGAAIFAAGYATSAGMTAASDRTTASPTVVSSPAKPVPLRKAASPSPSAHARAPQAQAAPAAAAAPAAPAAIPQSGSALADSFPASSSTPAPPPSTLKPPPCAFGWCVPWVGYKATSVINNNALLPIPAFGSSLDNNTPSASTLHDAVTGSVTVSAQLTGKAGADPSGGAIAGAIAELDPQVGVSATVSTTKTVDVQVPPGDQGVITFGVPAVKVKGYVYARDVTGHVTKTPMDAWAPLYPTVFGFNAYVTPLAGSGPKSEVPVIPVPAG